MRGMTSGLFFAALLWTAVLFGVIYGAIRLALVHDRTAPSRDAKREAEVAARKTI